jgi:hypothetical protein
MTRTTTRFPGEPKPEVIGSGYPADEALDACLREKEKERARKERERARRKRNGMSARAKPRVPQPEDAGQAALAPQTSAVTHRNRRSLGRKPSGRGGA